ncbi:hypothetical protein [Rickettsiella massiliensis]|uniref:hypothetical protein n=1 Tax=Rickettsiella massiliensis TaxID=676517 RepID=UPI00029B0F1C|nr:hypothetical protein [Rickettsiella massiliensis]
MLDSLKKKSVLYRSERELQFLADFSQIVDQLLQSHDSYLISTSNPRQSTLASIELEGYAPVYLRLYSTSDTRINYIYCSTLDAAHVLAIEDGLASSEHLLNQYAALLFPNHSIVSVRFRFYKRLSESKPFKSIFQKIVTMDFSSDRALLKQNQDRINVFPLKVFCRLFLINGQAPVIDQLHADIFSDKASKLSLSENFFEIFAFLSVTQRLQLAKLVKTYQIPLVSSVEKQDLGATLRFQLNQRIYYALESSVALNEGLMDKQLTELGSQVWRSSLLNKFSAEKTEIIVTTLNEACQRFTQHPGNVLSQTLIDSIIQW